MPVPGLHVASFVAERLGEAVPNLTNGLFAGACQTCGRENPAPTELVIDQVGPTLAHATLHHRRCRPSAWYDSSNASWHSKPYLTYAMRGAVVQLVDDDEVTMTVAIVLLNPALEEHVLRTAGDGRWISCALDRFEPAGLRPPNLDGNGMRRNCVQGVTARITTKAIFIDVHQPLGAARTFNGDLGPDVCTAAVQGHRVLLLVTQAMNPETFRGSAELNAVLSNPRTRMGWVGVTS